MTKRPRIAIVFASLIVLLAIVFIVSPLVGPTSISWSRALDHSIPIDQNTDRLIFETIRLPRALFGVLAGAVLALAGAVFQALLRNDLATPYTLGISGGATFGALGTIHLLAAGVATGFAALLIPGAAFAGAAIAVALILALAHRPRVADRMSTLLLAGVTMNLIFAAGVLILQYLANPYEAYGMLRWMMGGLDVASLTVPGLLLLPVLAGGAFLISRAHALNLMTLGDATATHLGIDAKRTRLTCLGVAAALTSLIVAYAGPIGFVGLIVPHAIRRLLGPDNRILLPASALAGAAFLIACDTAARAIGGATEIPVGILTACLGGPFFLWILFRQGAAATR
ncbi:iron ABC transporter permease [bacterium]|nr:iron ABC transporter permease [bacterium]